MLKEEYKILLQDKKKIEEELKNINKKIHNYENDLLNKIKNELKEFAIKNNSLFNGKDYDYRYSINFNYKDNKIEYTITKYHFSCFPEFKDKKICELAIQKFYNDLKEYYDIEIL